LIVFEFFASILAINLNAGIVVHTCI